VTVVLLNPGERILLQEDTEVEDRRGNLVLTDRRLVFEARRNQGLVHAAVRGHQYVALIDTLLLQISDVHVDRPLLGRPTLRVDRFGKGTTFRVRDAPAWSAWIIRARSQAPPTGGLQQGPVVVNVHAAPAVAPPAVYLHCTRCGTLSVAGAMRCSSCGAAL
jgi:hypothetical protein